MSVLLDHIFDAAAGMSPNTISAARILQLLGIPDTELAHALRGFDWGAPLLEVPRLVSAVPRTDTLVELTAVFNDSTAGRTPSVAVLSGITEFGKSTIAADFCHLNRHLYEHIIWIDCREAALIEAKAKDTLARLGVSVEPDSDVAALFRTEMGRIGGPFVTVFDSAADRRQIERFCAVSPSSPHPTTRLGGPRRTGPCMPGPAERRRACRRHVVPQDRRCRGTRVEPDRSPRSR
jgi:hypothetical protein